jgi:ATP-dependent DNA helicase RecG
MQENDNLRIYRIDDTIDETAKTTTQEIAQETTQEKILNLIKKNPSITQTQMANALGLTRDGISYNIK